MDVIAIKQGYSQSFICTADVSGITDYSPYTAYLTIVKSNKITDRVLQKTSTTWDNATVTFDVTYSELNLAIGNYILEFAIGSATHRYPIAQYLLLVETAVTAF